MNEYKITMKKILKVDFYCEANTKEDALNKYVGIHSAYCADGIDDFAEINYSVRPVKLEY